MQGKKIVRVTKTRILRSGRSYLDWQSMLANDDMGDKKEWPQANPDVLSESAGDMYKRGPNELLAKKLLEEAIQLLTDRQREVYAAYYYDYKTEQEIGEDLGIAHQTVSRLLQRAIVNITKHCHQRALELGMGDEKYD